MAIVTQKYESIQYDGTNGTYIAETFLDGANHSVGSDTGTQLTILDSESSPRTVSLNGWYVKHVNGEIQWYGSNANYANIWVEL